MTAAQAMAQAVKRWGSKAAVRDGGKAYASTPELRAAALAELRALRENRPETPRLFDRERWPDSTPLGEFRSAHEAAVADIKRYKETENRLQGEARAQRYSVGISSWAFEVRGSGDTWEQAFEAADRRAR